MTMLKTSHFAIIGAIALVISQGENIRSISARTTATADRKAIQKDHLKTEKERTRNAKELSKVALERYQANCIMVVESSTKKESYFQPGNAVVDTALGKPLRENALICNRLGDTAVVVNGAVENIASIATEDLPQFTAILESRGYSIAVPQTPKNPTPKATENTTDV